MTSIMRKQTSLSFCVTFKDTNSANQYAGALNIAGLMWRAGGLVIDRYIQNVKDNILLVDKIRP